MSWALALSQLPGTALFLAIVLLAAWCCVQLGMRVEHEDVERQIRAGRLIVVPEADELERLMSPYLDRQQLIEALHRGEL